MKNKYSKTTSKRLMAYSAMAAALVAGTDANAEIIYTDIEDVTIGIGEMYDLDIDGDAVMDFHFRVSFTSSSKGSVWSFGTAFGNYTSLGVGNSSNQIIGYAGTFYNYASFLEEGDPIGALGPWLNYPSLSNSAVVASNFYGATYGAFPGSGEGFAGIQFLIDGSLYYGWVRLVADIDPVYITIIDMAYETEQGVAIEAGATTSPVAVVNLPVGSVEAYNFGSVVHINNIAGIQDGLVQIFSMNGDEVFNIPLTMGMMQIDLSHIAKANYMLRITTQEGQFTRQVFMN